MRKVLLSLGLAAVTLTALPAAAQSYRYDRDNRGYNNGNGQYHNGASQELYRLGQQVDRAIQRGNLDRREAEYFRREIAQLRYLDQRYSRGGYSGSERRALDQRVDRLRARLSYERRDDDRRGDGRYGDGRYDDDRRDRRY